MSLPSAMVVEVGQQQVKGRRNESRRANTHQKTKTFLAHYVSFMALLKIMKINLIGHLCKQHITTQLRFVVCKSPKTWLDILVVPN